MLCQMEESGDSNGCTSFFYEGWLVHEGLMTGQGAPGNQVREAAEGAPGNQVH